MIPVFKGQEVATCYMTSVLKFRYRIVCTLHSVVATEKQIYQCMETKLKRHPNVGSLKPWSQDSCTITMNVGLLCVTLDVCMVTSTL